ncbi:MAG: DNA-methyltransferase [Chloroflexota bacterium]
MPSLIWPTKTLTFPEPAALALDSTIHPRGAGYPSHATDVHSPADQLIWGDNLAVMTSLLPAYEGKVNLIYADPPFFTNRKFPARVGRGEDSRKPHEWQLSDGYADHWKDSDAYLDFLYPRLALMHRLLAPNGTLYLHLDWHANAYARLLLDEIFGAERLLNEIVWCYHGPSPIRSAFNRKHDTILAYTKSTEYTFNVDAVRTPYDEQTVRTFAASPKAGFGKIPDLARGKVPEDWWYFPVVARLHNERTGYPTQKPEGLLERILRASSNEGDLVADFFCGSGTTPLVACRLKRRFIACDTTFRAIHTARVRLVQANAGPFQLWKAENSPVEHFPLRPADLQRSNQTVTVPADMLPALDYWEADPNWDGKIFHSAAQAVRPRKDQPIQRELTLPAPLQNLCLRLVTITGEQHQILC